MKIKITVYEPPATLPACCVCDFHTIEYYNSDGELTGTAFCGISEQSAKTCAVKAVYIDDDAKRFLWQQQYERLSATDRKKIDAVFPDLMKRDATRLKSPRDIANIAHLKIQKHFGETCTRCGGSGSYAQSVRYTELHDGICHKCGGSGKQVPNLTAKKLAEIKAFFEVRNEN